MKNIILVVLLLFSLITSCDSLFDRISDHKDAPEWDLRLKFQNKSNLCVYYYISPNYPDTQIIAKNPLEGLDFYKYCTKPNKSDTIKNITNWEETYEKEFKSKKMMLFVFDINTIEQNSWDEIREGYKILKRYDLSLEDLEKMDWTITYP